MLKSIRKKQLIKSIFKEGQVFDTSLFKVHYILNDVEHVKYALSVSKRLGIAVKRNRAKRVFKHAILKSIKTPVLCIFRLKKIDFSYYEAVEQLNFFQNRIKNKEFPDFLDKTL